MDAIRTGPRVRAPELTSATPVQPQTPRSLAELRGRFVLLDFWTSSCANCLHVLAELRPLESTHRDVLTVLGVHTPKFPHEADPATVAAAVQRYGITHPVLTDPSAELWRQYAVRAWPTLVLVDPEGYVVAQTSGQGQVRGLTAILDRLVADHEARGTLWRGPAPVVGRPAARTMLRYPSKAILLPAARTGRDADSLLVADSGHHQVVEVDLDGVTELRRIGAPQRGAPFDEPNGLALLPENIAPYDVLVADTGNHVLRGLRLTGPGTHDVETIDLGAGLAEARTVTGPVPRVLSPWDVAWWPARQRIVVAAAGVHLLLDVDPADATVEILAGTTVEGLRDGAALDGWLAQPSGLAVEGDRMWFVDAESSALRWLASDAETGATTLHTAVGEGLFDFGDVDGPAPNARLQHPLGVTLLGDGSLAVLDTYNGAVRRYDPATDSVSTLASGLAEPTGAVLVPNRPDGHGELVVVESGAHRLTRVATAPPHQDEAMP